MIARVIDSWNGFWFQPEARTNLVAVRILVAANALWILLSRPRLPDLRRWPAGFWSHADVPALHRYFIFPIGAGAEWILYLLLFAALIAAAFGVAQRASCLLAGILLYHFAPWEDILSADSPYFRGLGVPVLALLIIGFALDPKTSSSAEYRWPLKLIQLLFAFTYLFSGVAKLLVPGLSIWTSRQHFLLIVARSVPDSVSKWGGFLFQHPALAPIAATSVLVLDLLFVVVVFRPRAAWILVPAALVMHLVAPNIVGVVFLDAPLLLMFVDWGWIAQRRSEHRAGQPSTEA